MSSASPEYTPILDGAGGVRRSMNGPDPQFDFPVLRELHVRGGTDYVAMPPLFPGGQINIISLVSDRSQNHLPVRNIW